MMSAMNRKTETSTLLIAVGLHVVLLAAVAKPVEHTTLTAPRIDYVSLAPITEEAPAPAAAAPAAPRSEPTPVKPQPVVKREPRPVPRVADKSPVIPVPTEKAAPSTASAASDASPDKTASSDSHSDSRSGAERSESTAEVAPSFNAAYLSNPRPSYPPISREMGEQGTVMLRVEVSAEGAPVAVKLHKSSGFGRLDRAALDAVQRWRFVPAKRGSTAVAGSVLVPMKFNLT
ncbi:outer membrane transport energization protein TonB [Microvirgula sp. AG722]|nr:outer membrane transport energization protein TonB [Microvirgula sp. AG722]